MLIIDELTELKHTLFNKSSLKEQAFYQFLVNKPLSYPTKNDLIDIEQIIYSVYCANIPLEKDLTNLIEAHRRTGPIGGMHYTKNIIELTAMALEDPESEKESLRTYSESHSTRDFYILHVLFPDLESNRPIAQGAIDEIALHLYRENFPEKWKTLLLTGLKEISDLIDLYIIEEWYKRAMDDNPIVHRTNDIIYVRDTLTQIVEKTERRIKFAMGVVSVFLLLPIPYWLVPLIVKNWDEAEPTIFAFQFTCFMILNLPALFLGYVPEKIKFFDSLRETIINWVFKNWVFRKTDVNRPDLKERLNQLANQNEK